jgi:hypothetical protein
MRAVRLGCIQLATGRRKGGSDRDVRRPYDVQTVVALVSFSGGSSPRAGNGWGVQDGRCRARQTGDGLAPGTKADREQPSLCSTESLWPPGPVGTDPSMTCRVNAW